MSNHFASNIITRGNMNNSAITRGIVLPFFRFVIVTKKRGGSPGYYSGEGYYDLQQNLFKIRERENEEEIDVIKVYIDWNKNNTKYGKKIYATLIQKKIEAQLLENTKHIYKISVHYIKN